jgi:hypothetical protein
MLCLEEQHLPLPVLLLTWQQLTLLPSPNYYLTGQHSIYLLLTTTCCELFAASHFIALDVNNKKTLLISVVEKSRLLLNVILPLQPLLLHSDNTLLFTCYYRRWFSTIKIFLNKIDNIVTILLCVQISYTPLLSCHAVNMVTFTSRIRKGASGQLLDS